MRTIRLTDGSEALVSDEDYERFRVFRWHRQKTGRRRYVYRSEGGHTVYMHREIVVGFREVDHINGNELDNQRENLRGSTRSQNGANLRKWATRRTSSRFKGVTRRNGKYMAQIAVQGKNIYLGLYPLEEQAARAYDNAAIRHFGRFANLNFPRTEA
jgi:hypothetical protein